MKQRAISPRPSAASMHALRGAMKRGRLRPRRLAALLCVCVASLPSAASAIEETEDFRLGLGANVNVTMMEWTQPMIRKSFNPLGFANIQVPMRIAGVFAVEPEFGVISLTVKEQDYEITSTIYRANLGGFYLLDLAESTVAHLGARVGVQVHEHSERSGDTGFGSHTHEMQAVDVTLAPSAGVEYFVSEAFSIGAELQLNVVLLDDPSESGGSSVGEPSADAGQDTLVTTSAQLTIRWFFL